MPRSFSVATAPIARMIAANAPNWARFFQSWSAASAATGVGIGIGRQLVAGGGLDDLRQEPREQRRDESDEQEQPADDRQAQRPPRLEQLLAHKDPTAASSAPVVRVPTDEAQEDVLERRPDPLEDGQPNPAATTAAAARPTRWSRP